MDHLSPLVNHCNIFVESVQSYPAVQSSPSLRYQSKAHINFLLVINANVPPILHRFRDSRRQVRNRYTWLPLLCLTPPAEGFPWDDLR